MDIDVSKENIQPLRGGRNLVQLGTALQAQSDVDAQRQLQIQKEEHEAAIRNYHGTDPLDPWFNYIQWVEQCFPKHGHEGHIDKLIKDCLQLFEKDERYYQDRRFVKLWIKYIDCLSNPLEIYQRLHSSGIGVECSEFYRAWSCYCEESGDYKRANQVYMLGLQAKAQPLDELEQAHMNFQLYFAQRMLHDDSPTKRKAASALAETRMALTSLKSFKRRNIANVPVQRVGDSVRSAVPGVVRQGNNFDNRMPNSNVMVNVYQDAPSTSQGAAPTAEPGPASLVQACANVENEREVGVWTSAKIKMVHANVVPHQPLPFVPYEDEEDVLKLPANHMAYCVDDLTFTVPLCVPDPPDATKITCYNKSEVYVGEGEYSLEEIRSRKYQQKVHEKTEERPEEKMSVHESYSSFNESVAQCSALETLANCALDAEQDHLGHMMPLNIPTLQNITKVTNMHSPGEPKVLVNLDSKEFSELAARRSDDSTKQSESSDKENQVNPSGHDYAENAGNYGRNNLVEDFNRSLMSNLLGDSVTVNTKEARWELRNLFNDNGSMGASEPSMVQPIVQQFDVPKFDIHEDRSMTMALHSHKKPLQDAPDAPTVPEDKENAGKVPMAAMVAPQNPNKTAYFEEPCTQVFNFNIRSASTPNMSQFKKPSNMDHSGKMSSVPKFNMDESGVDHGDLGFQKKEEFSIPDVRDQHATVDHQGTGLSVIMEATREYNSKSGSSSSGQSTRGNYTGFNTPYSEKTQASNFDSMYSQGNDPTSSKRQSISTQPRTQYNSQQFPRGYPQKREQPETKPQTQPATVPYLSHDHQYQKPNANAQSYNGYPAPAPRPAQHYPGYGYQQPPGYSQGYASPGAAYSPQHPGHHQPGFQSPTYSAQQLPHGYHSPGHMMSPQHAYRQDVYHYPAAERAHVYAQPQPGFQSPPHQPQYPPAPHQPQPPPAQHPPAQHQQQHQPSQHQQQHPPTQHQQQHTATQHQPQHPPAQHQPQHQSAQHQPQHPTAQHQSPAQHQQQYYQRAAPAQHQQQYSHHAQPPAAQQQRQQQQQQNYHMQAQYASPNMYANAPQHPGNQSYNMQSPYRQPQKQPESTGYGAAASQPFQIYQSPQPTQNSYHNAAPQTPTQDRCQPMQTSPDVQQKPEPHANTTLRATMDQSAANKISPPKQPAPHKSPTAALRSVRHDQPNVKHGQNSPDIGFSNQFLNFISNRNEPKDNANTPKFTNSPSISHKMHKNLYVSSPEQAQIPPTSGLSDSDSKDSMTAQTATPIQSAKVARAAEKIKDISKRQLDFEHRAELQSEDSRDSVSKDGRISSVYSRQSDFHSDGYGMDVDSENSMECSAFKSTHSISLVETSDIPRPADIDFPARIDPFNKKMLTSLLEYVKFPNKTHEQGYVEVRSIPKLQVNTSVTVGNKRFAVEKQLGKGNYGAVFLCLDVHSNKSVAVKYQKPSRPWEFYICQEIKARIKDPFMLPGYMDITTGFIGENASLFVSEYSKYGSLLDVANKIRMATSKCIHEMIVFLLTSEMLSIVHYLHKAQIIHADIKPDNFLLMKIPAQEWRTPSLQLIDLGCSIDMSLFPEGTTFRERISTEGFTCTEMREGKPWTYQTDLYCLAGTIHVILMGSYMKVVNRLGQWNIDKKLPRYMKSNVWDQVFTTLLNVPNCDTLPDLMELKEEVDLVLLQQYVNLGSQLRTFANVLESR